MNKVRIEKVNLEEIVKRNRETHHGTFLKAQDGFRKRVLEELDKMFGRSITIEELDSAALSVRPKLRSPANSGAWSDYRIIGFTDGKTRRIESGIELRILHIRRGCFQREEHISEELVPQGELDVVPRIEYAGQKIF